MTTKFTRQGVKDLSFIKGKPKGKILAPVPLIEGFCPHTKTREVPDLGGKECLECGTMWDWDGKVW